MKREQIFLFIESMIFIFSGIFGFFLFLNLLFSFSIGVLISEIILGVFGMLYLIKAYKQWNSLEINNWGWFSIFSLFMVIFAVGFSSYSILDNAKQQWDDICIEKGLSLECNDKDLCEKDCKELGKEFYKHELGGLFNNKNDCWCKDGNNTKQIY